MVSRKFLLVMAAGVVSAAFSYLGTGLHPVWWALWLAPIPVLAISPRLHGSTAFFLGAIVWLIGEVNQWNYVKHAIEPPPRIIILFCSSCCGFRLRRSIRPQFHSPRIALPRVACFSRLLGGVRISYCDGVASQHMGQSRVHTNELSPRDPDCCDYRHLGNQLHRISVCRCCGSLVERSGRTMAATPAPGRCRAGHLRSACFWQMAIAIESRDPIGGGDTHCQRPADERLSWL